ncbi:hypothetical protein SVAN01_10388 [Stagonosporopsis vannaccii]|nr:hypothetical protein SVAN01_10388 [Stagonosporopsis vannaccii]
MASNVSPLLTPTHSASFSTDAPSWLSGAPRTPSADYARSYDPLVPNVAKSTSGYPTPSKSSTAYEPGYLESNSEKYNLTHEQTTFRSSASSWALEIIAILISSGSIVALVAVLYRENGRPLSGWTLAITLNTVIAALGTLARTTLAFAISACIGQQKWAWLRRTPDSLVAWERFDEASRGPWGGARLFVWLRMRHWAALGALVTVGSIAFDPFLQAVISNYGQMDNVPSSSDATIGTSLRIDSGTIMALGEGGGAKADELSTGKFSYLASIGSRPDFGFISSVYNGFQNISTFRNDAIGAECSTGNCTWPVFSSAAVCSACEDVSSHMQSIRRYGGVGTNIPRIGYPSDIYKGEFVAFTLPYGNIRNYLGAFDDSPAANSTTPTRTYMTANTTFEAIRTISFKDLETMLMAFLVMRAPQNWLDSQGLWEDAQPVATECALYLCANAYQSKSENNLVNESIIGSWTHKVPDSYKLDNESAYFKNNPGAEAWIESLGSTLYDAKVERTDLQLTIPEDLSADFPANMTRKFNVSHNFIFSAIDFLVDYTQRKQQSAAPEPEMWGMLAVPWPGADLPPVVDALWNSTNLTTTFDNVARSLTNQMRNSSPVRHQGKLQKWILHVRVDWVYLTYPVTILVTGIMYVILTIIESTRLRLPVWKESALPTLLHGFDDETQMLLRAKSKAAQRRALVHFEQDEKECLRLVAQT